MRKHRRGQLVHPYYPESNVCSSLNGTRPCTLPMLERSARSRGSIRPRTCAWSLVCRAVVEVELCCGREPIAAFGTDDRVHNLTCNLALYAPRRLSRHVGDPTGGRHAFMPQRCMRTMYPCDHSSVRVHGASLFRVAAPITTMLVIVYAIQMFRNWILLAGGCVRCTHPDIRARRVTAAVLDREIAWEQQQGASGRPRVCRPRCGRRCRARAGIEDRARTGAVSCRVAGWNGRYRTPTSGSLFFSQHPRCDRFRQPVDVRQDLHRREVALDGWIQRHSNRTKRLADGL